MRTMELAKWGEKDILFSNSILQTDLKLGAIAFNIKLPSLPNVPRVEPHERSPSPVPMMNESTSFASLPAVPGSPLISIQLANILLPILCVLVLTVSVPAFLLNILNVIIFVNTKIDSITVCFIALALSDLSAMLFLTGVSSVGVMSAFQVPWGKNLSTYAFLFTFGIGLSVDTSSAFTTYIALQRGLCVALPFLTRHLFNRNRSIIICVSVFIFILACSTPRATAFRLKYIPDPADNTSAVAIIQFLETWVPFDSFYTIFIKTVMVCVEFGVLIICTSLISYSMHSSIKLKLHSSAQYLQHPPSDDKKTIGREDKTQRKKDAKELLVVKQSLIVVLIHVILTTPRMLASLYVVFEPRYRVGAQYQNLYYVTFTSISVTDSINAFANFFVYVKFNSKFRAYFINNIYRRVTSNSS
ncbi:hypothetical protein EGW08_023685 [Elysia chlorotica]|uniref:G-protein coupled receptors family 1 profile domain-containing protein n=1 Tax=Elysia chlorotica TaxID=188477 RepID=A0A433SIE3_ELYCH|nr:hypothetical protein EGW08_023685 [Elysia chlorotica]